MHSCNQCGATFTRGDNLKRHEKLHYTDIHSYKSTEPKSYRKRIKLEADDQEPHSDSEKEAVPNQIPTFDGDEFSGKKPKSRETLYKMMKMLKIPEHRWENIATDILKEDRERVRSKDLSNFIDEDEDESGKSGDEDAPMNESEIEELCKRFKLLQYGLIYKGHREYVSELLDMLDVLLEEGLISQADYIQKTNKVKDL